MIRIVFLDFGISNELGVGCEHEFRLTLLALCLWLDAQMLVIYIQLARVKILISFGFNAAEQYSRYLLEREEVLTRKSLEGDAHLDHFLAHISPELAKVGVVHTL